MISDSQSQEPGAPGAQAGAWGLGSLPLPAAFQGRSAERWPGVGVPPHQGWLRVCVCCVCVCVFSVGLELLVSEEGHWQALDGAGQGMLGFPS